MRSMRALFYLVLSIVCCPVIAGDERGNGGGVIVCPDKKGGRTVRLLDFWEAEALKGMKIRRSSAPRLKQVDEANMRLVNIGQKIYSGYVGVDTKIFERDFIQTGKGFLPSHIAIAPPRDALNKFIEKGCTLEGVALYDDAHEQLDLDKELFNDMSTTDQAGLLFHEAFYKVLREKLKVEDSIVARNITACAFADPICPELSVVFGIPDDAKLFRCYLEKEASSKSFDHPTFYLFKTDNNWHSQLWRFQLLENFIKPPLAREYFDFQFSYGAPDEHGYFEGGGVIGFTDGATFKTKSSEDRWKDIGLAYPYSLDVPSDGILRINGRKVKCSPE